MALRMTGITPVGTIKAGRKEDMIQPITNQILLIAPNATSNIITDLAKGTAISMTNTSFLNNDILDPWEGNRKSIYVNGTEAHKGFNVAGNFTDFEFSNDFSIEMWLLLIQE